MKNFKRVIDKAKSLTIFIYAHQKTSAMMGRFTSQHDIVTPRITRFASAFLALQSLEEQKRKRKFEADILFQRMGCL